jgi:hypothetical protein
MLFIEEFNMPIPVSKEYYTYDLENLLEELTPSQQRKLADWVVLVAHYSRELIGRAEAGGSLTQYLLDNPNIELIKVERIRQQIEKRDGKKNLEYLRDMFDALQETIVEYSFLKNYNLENEDN